MTGEITLRGRVLPVGGLKEKILAAHRAGIDMVIVPEDNRKNIEEIPERIKEEIKIVYASNMDTVLDVSMTKRNEKNGRVRHVVKSIHKDKKDVHLPENQPVIGDIEGETAIMEQ